MSDPFYITTAIAYPNGRPHIGHAYEAIATDAIARFQRLMGRDVRLVTGTDEHGLKMAQTARNAGRDTLAFADEMSSYFKDMCATLNISYDRFCRTTEEQHHAASIALWQRMAANDDLYLDRYEGWYSVRDEAFYGEEELVDGEGGQKLSPQGTPVEWTVEESWFFRLSKYQERLRAFYRDNPDFIRPESRRNEVIRFVEGGLKDLSVSRTSFDWGVPVPGSPGHVMYVWVDALTTYMTGVGFPDETGDFARFWPANVHIIGKDIVRFHAVYWPAFLMSAELPLPHQVFGHGFILARDGAKMGKSAGNAADPLELAERYGVDQFRYFLLREVNFGQDGSWSEEAIVLRSNAELANSFGNLAQRTLSMVAKNLDGKLPRDFSDMSMAFIDRDVVNSFQFAADRFSTSNMNELLDIWNVKVTELNQYIDSHAPWALRKTNPQQMEAVLARVIRCLRPLAIMLWPFCPSASINLLRQLGYNREIPTWADLKDRNWYEQLQAEGFIIQPPVGIFPRLEMPAEEAA